MTDTTIPASQRTSVALEREVEEVCQMVYETHMLTIGQLARMLDINPRTLRYYERIGLLIPLTRSAAGYRLYSEVEADRLAFIRRAQHLGWSLHEIASIIAVCESGVPPCRHVRSLAEAKAREIDARIEELTMLRQEMVQLARAAVEVEPNCAKSSSICLAFEPNRSPGP